MGSQRSQVGENVCWGRKETFWTSIGRFSSFVAFFFGEMSWSGLKAGHFEGKAADLEDLGRVGPG